MGLLKAILENEVYPAMGCTEPISCAYAASVAAKILDCPVEKMELQVDCGTFKNGSAVTVPHSDGSKGNLIAAALGALVAKPETKLEILGYVTPELLEPAKILCLASEYTAIRTVTDFRVDVKLYGGGRTARCVLACSHTHIERIEENDQPLPLDQADFVPVETDCGYRDALRNLTVAEAVSKCLAELDDTLRAYIARGVTMNLEMAAAGESLRKTAYQMERMHEKGILAADMVYRAKKTIAQAVDARMAGVAAPVMTSGGSGNQGIVAILTPHLVGEETGIDGPTILESIVVAHVVNSYIKCYMGELAVVCGCAIAAGVAASLAIVYQQKKQVDAQTMQMAANNVIGDLSGLICDGAKPGCAMKTVTSVDAAIRSAMMALDGYSLGTEEGVVGLTLESTIANLSKIALEGMFQVDPMLLDILEEKAATHGHA